MILYVNGDGHAAGADLAVPVVDAEEDIDLWWQGQMPHPDNLSASFSNRIAKVFKARLVNRANGINTSDSIINDIRAFVDTNLMYEITVLVVGFPTCVDTQALEEYLTTLNVPHIFYTTAEYTKWLQAQGHEHNERGFFDADAHQAWANHLVRRLTKIL